ncbi:Carnitine O-acetyltransferase mitochondrial [Gonapodya sp. JEL0774]|nr:Carnitine O-acetyltransferase mitochondrial [Gonapodya sp. JEL0774]
MPSRILNNGFFGVSSSLRTLRSARSIPASRRQLFIRKGPPTLCSSLDEAVQCVKPGHRVYAHSFASEAIPLLEALARRKDLLAGPKVEVIHYGLQTPNPTAEESRCPLEIPILVPIFVSEVPRAIREGPLKPDVAFVTVSPPDEHGYCSLGDELTAAYAAVEQAPIVVAVINKHQVRTNGMSFIHMEALDYVVEHDRRKPQAPTRMKDVDRKIGSIIAGLIPDGATLQVGIGGMPEAVLANLSNHKDLGMHTEMLQDGCVELIEKGVITNVHKKIMPGVTTSTFAVGTDRLYKFLHNNQSVAFLDAAIANDPSIIRQNPRVTAINSAIEVDLTGQVCADSIGETQISGVGGQVDFISGAGQSEGGVPIICLPSVTSSGESRIVPVLKRGAGVTTTRYHIRWVVTEHGAVNLFGKNYLERARLLIGIAHPSHREHLEKAAFERFKVKVWDA